MKILHQIDAGSVERASIFDRYDSTAINVTLTTSGGDTITFHASRETLAEIVSKLNTELEKAGA